MRDGVDSRLVEPFDQFDHVGFEHLVLCRDHHRRWERLGIDVCGAASTAQRDRTPVEQRDEASHLAHRQIGVGTATAVGVGAQVEVE
ncbi:Uncharacterised protein [Mycobacteroides abscessus subsp. abscessus]|nr:Uncharacterised protein [Mycobacteroides abscessus subsp. abscessus]